MSRPVSAWVPASAFVVVWSSGYIAGPWAVEAMAPLSVVAWRFVVAAVLAGALAAVVHGRPRLDRTTVGRLALVGFVMNAVQFGAMYLAFERGLSPTLGALLHSLSPVVTALVAGALLGERLTGRQVLGFVAGVAGVLLVLGPEVDEAGGPAGLALALVGLGALSLGSLGQRWVQTDAAPPDAFWAATVQFAVSGPPMLVLALALEGTHPVDDPVQAGLAVGYLAVVNSLVGLVLLAVVMRSRGGAGAASSVFFLMPPVTAVMAWLLRGDTLDAREVVGLVVTVVAVAVATRERRAPERPAQDGTAQDGTGTGESRTGSSA